MRGAAGSRRLGGPVDRKDQMGVDPAAPVASVELAKEGLWVDFEEASVVAQEPANIGGSEEVELVGLHPHEVLAADPGLFRSPLDANATLAPGGSEIRAKGGGFFSHGAPRLILMKVSLGC